MKKLPSQYADLYAADVPKIIKNAVPLYGIVETPGSPNNVEIMSWAKENPDHIKGYTADSIPWCGLFAAVVVNRAGFDVPENPLWALNWLQFGNPSPTPGLGDILVWKRSGGGHVGFYVGEDRTHYYVLGGNQGDKVSIIRLTKTFSKTGVGFRGARRPKWKVQQPASVKPVLRRADGSSTNATLV